MAINDLNDLELTFGFFTLSFTLISLILGLIMLLKYFSLKEKILVTVGLSWVFISSAWWGGSISFVMVLATGNVIPPFWY